jgi:hypothetical protein
VQVPDLSTVTVVPDTVQTGVVELVTVGARPAASVDTVRPNGPTPNVFSPGLLNDRDWPPLVIVMVMSEVCSL